MSSGLSYNSTDTGTQRVARARPHQDAPRPQDSPLNLPKPGRRQQRKFQQAVEAVEREDIEVFAAHYSAYAMSWIAKSEDFPPLAPGLWLSPLFMGCLG